MLAFTILRMVFLLTMSSLHILYAKTHYIDNSSYNSVIYLADNKPVSIEQNSKKSVQNEKIGVFERLGQFVDMDFQLKDSDGKITTLRQLANGRPVVLGLVYYTCPSICSPIMQGMVNTLDFVDLNPLKDYSAIVLSFDANDTVAYAKEKKLSSMTNFRKTPDFPNEGIKFTVAANKSELRPFTDSLGFFYKKVTRDGVVDYIHTGGLIFLSPEGKITRYINGIKFNPSTVELALMQSRNGIIGTTIANALKFCFAYDPEARTYSLAWSRVLAVLMTLGFIGFFIYLMRSGRAKKQEIN